MGPLKGMKVVDLTHVMAGPTCTLMLADMGVDVVKAESPEGDDMRRTIPPSIGDEAASFLMMNRNKRGVVLDLKTADGRAILQRMAHSADVLVENFAPSVMERTTISARRIRLSSIARYPASAARGRARIATGSISWRRR